MNVTFNCSRCGQTVRSEMLPGARSVSCSHCQAATEAAADAIENGQLHGCVLCPSHELFLRKDFPQRVGVGIVVVGLGGFLLLNWFHQSLAAYAVLFGTALLDAGLYLGMGSLLECYRCHAQYRGAAGIENHAAFDLETHERHRQQRLRLAGAKTSLPTGDRPAT